MPLKPPPVEVYLELGQKRVFAAARAWPGWCRSGRDEAAALAALFAAGPRYARALKPARLGFAAPAAPAALTVVERRPGTATTDFGAPEAIPAGDDAPVDAAELQRLQAVLAASWRALESAAAAAAGRPLRTGPRGGGRDLAHLLAHVAEAQAAYLGRLGGRAGPRDPDPAMALKQMEAAIAATLAAAARGELPAAGPRGGRRWTPRAFVRRAAWHVLDHAWEIEDRLGG